MMNPADINLYLTTAQKIVEGCESALARRLPDGERRDLLKDNTDWTTELVAAVVAALRLRPCRVIIWEGMAAETHFDFPSHWAARNWVCDNDYAEDARIVTL